MFGNFDSSFPGLSTYPLTNGPSSIPQANSYSSFNPSLSYRADPSNSFQNTFPEQQRSYPPLSRHGSYVNLNTVSSSSSLVAKDTELKMIPTIPRSASVSYPARYMNHYHSGSHNNLSYLYRGNSFSTHPKTNYGVLNKAQPSLYDYGYPATSLPQNMASYAMNDSYEEMNESLQGPLIKNHSNDFASTSPGLSLSPLPLPTSVKETRGEERLTESLSMMSNREAEPRIQESAMEGETILSSMMAHTFEDNKEIVNGSLSERGSALNPPAGLYTSPPPKKEKFKTEQVFIFDKEGME